MVEGIFEMKRMTGKLYIIYLILALEFGYSRPSVNILKYTIQRDQLEHAGLVRLSDVFFLIDEFDCFSIDGFTWQSTLKDFDLHQQQNWILMINDQTIQTKIFDAVQLNLLPYSTDHIDSIEVFVYPQVVGSEFSDKGIVHLHTRKTEPGLTLQGQFTAGNRTGDPGPYRYTEYWSENIDRIAADESYWLAYADSGINIGVGYYAQLYYPTDPRMADRLRDIYTEHNPYISSKSYSLRVGFSEMFSYPHIEIFNTTMEDLYFFKPAGREIPTIHDFIHMGISGGGDISGRVNFNYRFYYQNHKLENRSNKYNYNFDCGIETLGGDIRSGFHTENSRTDLGVGIEQVRANSGYSLSERMITFGKIYGSYHYNGFTNHMAELSGMFEFGDVGNTGKLSLLDHYQISKTVALTGAFSFSETNILEENTLWYWVERGYDIVTDLGGSYEIEENLLPARQWIFDLTLKKSKGRWLSVEGGLSVRRFISKNWELQPLKYDPDDKTVSGPITIKTAVEESRGRFFLKINFHGPSPLLHQFYYHYSAEIETNSSFKELWKSVPQHRFIYRLEYKPVETFSIWSMFKYQSSVFWYDYRNIDSESNGDYSSHLSDILSWDLAINKWLWNKQIKVDVIFRNIFNRENIYFPIGASMDLRFFAQAELYFNFM